MTRRDVDPADIQAIARTAFGLAGKGAVYMLLRIEDRDAAKQWLASLKPARCADLSSGGVQGSLDEATQVAFTAAGPARSWRRRTFDRPAVWAGDSWRAWRATRTGRCVSATPARTPRQNWSWGVGAREPHILVMLFADSARIASLESETREGAERSGLKTLAALPTSDMGGVEPFGFVDGVSQPSFDWQRACRPDSKADRRFTNLLALGELLLSYGDEYGYPAQSPKLLAGERGADLLPPCAQPAGGHDLGRNGSYLVYRQLAQDVRGFWRWAAKEANRAGITMEALAEAAVGRRLDGRPLVDFQVELRLPGIEPGAVDRTGFLFDADPDGLSCPIGAHIRRANPRTGDAPAGLYGFLDYLLDMLGLTMRRCRRPTSSTLPWPRNTTVWPIVRSDDDAIASSRFHRILRRGREYGAKIDREAVLNPATQEPESGLHFLCLNANIARQFEFVQGAWIANAKFAGLSGEQDPLLGNREPFPTPPVVATPELTDAYSRPGADPHCRRATSVPQFVVVRGGGYFFLPGLAALSNGSRARRPVVTRDIARRRAINPHRIFPRPSARCGERCSSSAGMRRAGHTYVCAPGSDCRAAGGREDNARD